MAGQWLAPGTLTVGTERLVDGEGHSINDERDLFVIHAAMMHTGKVLMFCGHVEDSHYALVSYLFDWRTGALEVDGTGNAKRFPFPQMSPRRVRAGGSPHGHAEFRHADLFCAHMVQLEDGRILVLGGSDPDFVEHSSVGDKYICYFDPSGSSPHWSMALETRSRRRPVRRDNVLAEGRWYPTAVMLPDGRVAVVSGRKEDSTIARTVEIIQSDSPTSRRFRAQTQTGADFELPIYPGLHLAPNGRIYYTHTTWGWEVTPPTNTLSIQIPSSPATSASWSTHPAPAQQAREEGMSVLLPPAQDGKILLIGGALAVDATNSPVVADPDASFAALRVGTNPRRAEILNTTTNTWSNAGTGATAGLTIHPRINGHCVILPDKKVLILGGHNAYKWSRSATTTPSLICEIYDPATNTFTADDSLTHPRTYHSAAVLLPNGTVLVAGGVDPNNNEPAPDNRPWSVAAPSGDADDWYDDPSRNWGGPRYGPHPDPAGPPAERFESALNQKTFEIYQPPYFFPVATARCSIARVTRGSARRVTQRAVYGENVQVTMTNLAGTVAVGLMRPGTPTHHTDSEQRYIDLTFTQSGDTLTVTMPADATLAPLGWYMLWVSAGGRPCVEAYWLRLVRS